MPLLTGEDLEKIEDEPGKAGSPGPPGQIERRVWQPMLVEDGRRKDDQALADRASPAVSSAGTKTDLASALFPGGSAKAG